MSTFRSLSKCIILTTCIVSVSSFRIFDEAILQKLRPSDDEFGETIQTEENDQDDGQTKILLGKKNVHFDAGVLRSGLPEEILRSIRSSLIPRNPYAGLPLRYLTMINGK